MRTIRKVTRLKDGLAKALEARAEFLGVSESTVLMWALMKYLPYDATTSPEQPCDANGNAL